jgi:3-aminobutyryl-CoA ammonia-lyase
MSEGVEARMRLKLNHNDTHYGEGLIPAATLLRLFADCSSELGIRFNGSDGYLAAYESANFLKAVYAGDYIEITAKVLSKGNRSRRVGVIATRSIRSESLGGGLVTGQVIDPPEEVANAVLVSVRPKT